MEQTLHYGRVTSMNDDFISVTDTEGQLWIIPAGGLYDLKLSDLIQFVLTRYYIKEQMIGMQITDVSWAMEQPK